jgi:signal peptidase
MPSAMLRSERVSAEIDIGTGCRLAPEGTSRRAALLAALVLLAFVGIYLLSGYAQPGFLSAFSRIYVLYPLMWLGLALVIAVISWKGRAGRIVYTRRFLWAALLVGAFQVAVLAIAGLFNGFGRSPYSHTPYYILLNTSFFGSPLVGMEFARSYLLNSLAGWRTDLTVIVASLMFALLSLPLARLTGGTVFTLTFFAGTCLPLVARSLVATYLALVTRGPLASIAYLGVLLAFEWYSPILPDLSWILTAFVGTMSAVIGLLALQTLCESKTGSVAELQGKGSSLTGWVFTAVVCVAVIFVSFGLLGFRPMVVGSGSMSPALDAGDIAVITRVSPNAIDEGDIIQFDRSGTTVIHRVVEVHDDGSPVFITQGDANDSPDSNPVYPIQIEGRVRFRIPKLGWIAVAIKNLFG